MKRTVLFTLPVVLVLLLVAQFNHPSLAAPTAELPWQLVLPDAPTRLYPSVAYQTDGTLFITTDRTLLRSSDDGDTWGTLYPQPPLTETLGVVAFAASPSNNTLFLARNVPSGPAEVYRSQDGGLTWGTVFSTTAVFLQDIALAQDTTQQLHIFAIGGGHVWRSTDGGDIWQPADTGLPEFADLYHVYPSPAFANDQTVYLTGFGPLIRSTNGGDEWQVVTIPDVDIPRHVIFSPDYAADQTLWFSYFFVEGSDEADPNGVARSTDGGQTWEIVSQGLPVDWLDGWIMGLAVSPNYSQDSRLFAIERLPTSDGTAWALYRSPDGGDNWWQQGFAPDATPTGLAAVTPDHIFLPTQQGLWRLSASCSEWVVNGDMETITGWEMPTTPATAVYSTARAHSGLRSIQLGIVEGDNLFAYSSARQLVTVPETAVSATLTLWLSPTTTATSSDAQYLLIQDEGQNTLETLLWTLENSQTWQPHTFDLSNYIGQTIWIYAGVYNNGLGGITGLYMDDVSLTTCEPPAPGPLTHHTYLPTIKKEWQVPPPPLNPPAGALLINGQQTSQLIGHPTTITLYGLTSAGLYRSEDGAQSWALVNASPPVTQSLFLAPSQPDVLYGGPGYPCFVGGDDVPLWKSEDGGQTWNELPKGVNLEPLAVHPTNPDWVYARGCDGPWLSTDGGNTWVLQPDDLFLTYDVFSAAPADDWQTVYLSGVSEGGGGALIGSSDGGNTWERLSPLHPDPWAITALAVDPISSTHVYFGEANAFWGSQDGGATWYTSTNGLEGVVYDPSGPITGTYGLLSLVYNPVDLDHWLLGTVRGIYTTSDRGLAWTPVESALWQEQRVTALLLREVEPAKLFLTTPEGVYVYYLE